MLEVLYDTGPLVAAPQLGRTITGGCNDKVEKFLLWLELDGPHPGAEILCINPFDQSGNAHSYAMNQRLTLTCCYEHVTNSRRGIFR